MKLRDPWIATALLCLLLLIGLVDRARADVITEFGMGYKMGATSYLLTPDCERAQVVAPEWPKNPRPPPQTFSCGGDNPAFIGWPIAWQHTFKDEVVTIRAGWFHYSNWFDGGANFTRLGDRHETHMDLAAVSITWNWSAMKRKRKSHVR